jgi:hypothetical protein
MLQRTAVLSLLLSLALPLPGCSLVAVQPQCPFAASNTKWESFSDSCAEGLGLGSWLDARHPPGPPSMPVLGNVLQFQRHGDVSDQLIDQAALYGGISRCTTGIAGPLRGRAVYFVAVSTVRQRSLFTVQSL